MASITVKKHWRNVRALGCLLSAQPSPTLHHCHGGSMTQIRGIGVLRGTGEKASDYLVIPLAAHFHVGQCGIDGVMGVVEWERNFGAQVDLLDEVCRRVGYDVWALAGVRR
jgi:hypothetical protein